MLETHIFFSWLLSHSPCVPVLRVAQNSAVRVQWDQRSEASAFTLCSGPFPGMAPSQPQSHFSHRIPTRSLETHPFLLSPPGLCSLGTAVSPSKQEPGCIPRCSVDCRGHLSVWWHRPLLCYRVTFLAGTVSRGLWESSI